MVLEAARKGMLTRLKLLLEPIPLHEAIRYANAKTRGATPLGISSYHGHIAIVKHLITRYKTDIEQTTLHENLREPATPLWHASSNGHFEIVKLLVNHGANINSTTKSKRTPLRAACESGHQDIVDFLIQHGADVNSQNIYGQSCLMTTCYIGHLNIVKTLIEAKANVNQRCIKGITALHDCAGSGWTNLVELLLENNAVLVEDVFGVTPLLAAAAEGRSNVVRILLNKYESITQQEKFDSLLLLGAAMIDKYNDKEALLHYWEIAFKIRLENTSTVHLKQLPTIRTSAYKHTVEILDLETLQNISLNEDELFMQALLARERILGKNHPDTGYYTIKRGQYYARTGKFDKCIDLWKYAFYLNKNANRPQQSKKTYAHLRNFILLFHDMANRSHVDCIKCHDLSWLLKEAEFEIINQSRVAKHPETNGLINRFAEVFQLTIQIIGLIDLLLPYFNAEEKHHIKRSIFEIIKNAQGPEGQTLLHLACTHQPELDPTSSLIPTIKFPSLGVVSLLIECGADATATDEENNSPLHTIAFANPFQIEIINLLLEKGAHLDQANNYGITYTDIAVPLQPAQYKIKTLKFTSLQCLAARAIKNHDICYQGQLSTKVSKFIQMH